jgi:hypothetical protein
MEDFRAQLTGTIDAMLAEGVQPVFLIVDLIGADYIKRAHGADSLDTFRQAALTAITATAGGDTFAYSELRVVGVLPGHGRLKTFAIIDKLRRALPLLAQSFDCLLEADFDVLEYDPGAGVAGLINHLVHPPTREAA